MAIANEDFTKAAKEGDIAAMKEMIKAGVDVNYSSEKNSGYTAMSYCLRSGNLEAVQLLIDAGADVNKRYSYGLRTYSFVIHYVNNHQSNTENACKIIEALTKAGLKLEVDSSENCFLFSAISQISNEDKCATIVEKLLALGADANSKDRSGNTVMMKTIYADEKKALRILEILLKNDADINAVNISKDNALGAAIQREKKAIVKFLLENGADVNHEYSTYSGKTKTLLTTAIENGDTELVELLLLHKAKIDKDKARQALKSAIFGAKYDSSKIPACSKMIELLVNKGKVDVNCVDEKGESILFELTGENAELQEAVVKVLKSLGADFNKRNNDGKTALLNSINHYDTESALRFASILLKNKADANAVDKDGNTLLHLAASSYSDRKADFVAFMVKNGADVNKVNKKKQTALHIALDNDNPKTVQLLLEAGAVPDAPGTKSLLFNTKVDLKMYKKFIEKSSDLNAKNDKGQTPIMAALEYVKYTPKLADYAQALLEKGIDVNATDKKGNSALSYACKAGNFAVAKSLIEKGANVNIADSEGNTLLIQAAAGESIELVKLLVEKGADVNSKNKYDSTAISEAGSNNDFAMIQYLVEKGAEIDIVNGYGRTPLIQAARKNNAETMAFLLEKGAKKLDVAGMGGKTALHYACYEESLKNISLLLEKGANPNIQDDYGNTPLHYVIYTKKEELVKPFLQVNIDLTVKNKKGQTALDIAEGKVLELLQNK